jgi:membrane-bound metal-dependent hydrolase YbcI (DUF457 family)
MKNNRHFLHFILAALLVVSINLFFYQKSFAMIGFGGNILSISPCANGFLMVIGPPSGGLFLLPPWSMIYAFYNLKPGAATLGMYTPGGFCVIGPVVIPTQGMIYMIGTSIK